MLASFTLRSSTLVVSQMKRNFARVPSIRFLGPRSKTDKHVGAYASAPGHGAVEEDVSNKKTLSLFAELEFADIPADRWARIPFSESEIECIN